MNLQVITHLGVAAWAALAVWVFQDARWRADVAEVRLEATNYKLDLSNAQRAADARIRQAEKAMSTKYQEALNAARIREAHLRTELDHLHVANDGLRWLVADADRRLANAPPAAVLEYAAALGVVFDDCRAAYAGLAAKAAGHAADVQTLRDAWPVIPNPPEGKK